MSTPSRTQTDVVRFLADPGSHAGPPPRVERIDTHSATVFLAGERAYKMKREVRYSFLDYSTLELRRQACEAELRLNRRTAPGLYLGVSAVTREPDGSLAIGGNGVAVEWLVVMRRFADDLLLDRQARAGAWSPGLSSKLADAVAGFHAGAARTPHRGGAADLDDVVRDNSRALAEAGGTVPPAQAAAVATACEEGLARHGALIERRRATGFVRQCHGDLHLRNIVLLDGVPTLFDAIEFNDAFACIDVWYDLAFLLMDLEARELREPANALFNQYLLRTGDLSGVPLLPLFLACRAAIRAKTSLASAALEGEAARKAEFERRARDYVDLAARLAAAHGPRLVAIGGRSGSGKSTLAALLAPELGGPPGAVVLRSDVLRKVLLHRRPEERLGPEGYTDAVTREVYRAMELRAGDVLAEGWPVIADATFLDGAARGRMAEVARRAGVPFRGIWLDAPVSAMADRLRRREHDASDATPDVLGQQVAAGTGPIEWTRIDATADPDALARTVWQMVCSDDRGDADNSPGRPR